MPLDDPDIGPKHLLPKHAGNWISEKRFPLILSATYLGPTINFKDSKDSGRTMLRPLSSPAQAAFNAS